MSGPRLHEFIADHHKQILAMCVEKMRGASPGRRDEELAFAFDAVLDDIVRALQAQTSLARSSHEHRKSSVASRVGAQRQRGAFGIEEIPFHFGAVSSAVGELGAKHELSFAAGEYQLFNECIDACISAAIEEFSQARAEEDSQASRRNGFLFHEIRNALSSARMSFTVLRQSQVGIHSRTGDVLDRSLSRLQDLVNQSLLVVQLSAGAKAAPARMRMGELLRDVAEMAVSERGIRVVVDADDGVELRADEKLLVSALGNLVQNAIKFTHDEGEVRLLGRNEAGVSIIEVEDECGGLPEGMEGEIFQPYVQCGNDRRGLGLGLSITRDAVQAHGGAISVRNIPGKGCIFSVALPLEAADAKPAELEAERV